MCRSCGYTNYKMESTMFGNLREREEQSEKILFWSDEHRPEDYVGCIEDVYVGTLDSVISALQEAEVHQSYKGWANCRICDANLGSRDLYHEGFIFPSQAEHYIQEHGVWTPGLQRFAEALNRAPISEEREKNEKNETTCGIFIPIPFSMAKEFPNKDEYDDSVPHFTVLYVGDCDPEAYKLLCKIVCQVARKIKPFHMDMSHYGEFMNKEKQKIAHMKPSIRAQFKLAALHGILRRAIEQLGKEIKVGHTYDAGKLSKKIPYEAQFKAHATLAYLPPMAPYRGPKPTGSWLVNELEVWGHEKHRIPLGRTHGDQPTGLVRDPLALDYPLAVPEPVAESVSRGVGSLPALRGYERHATPQGTGPSHGDIPLDGTLPTFEVRKQIDKALKRKKLKGI